MFGKENMNISRAAVIAAIFLLISVSARSLDLAVNGEPTGIPVASLFDLRRDHFIKTADGKSRIVSGTSLGEVLPLFYDVHRMEIETVESAAVLTGDHLADRLFDAVVWSEGGGWSLFLDGEVYEGVQSISLWGAPLESRELEVWLSWEGTDLIGAEIQRFAELHGLDIAISEIPNSRSKLIAVSRAGGIPADLVMIQSDYLADLVDNHTLQPIESMLSENVLGKGRGAFDYAGRTWAYPFYFDSHLLFYNTNLISERPSLSWTLEDLEALSAELLVRDAHGADHGEAAVIPISWNAYSAYWLTPFVIGFGKDRIVDAQGRVVVDDESTRRAVGYVLYLREHGYLEVMERDAMTAYFATGRVAMILSGSYSIPHFERLGLPFSVLPYPAVPGTGRHVAPFLDFKGLAVPRRARHPVLARRLIQYLSTPAVQAAVSLPLRKMPASAPAWELIRDSHPYFEVLEESYRIGTPVPTERSYATYKSLMWRLLRFVFTEQMSVEEMLATGDELLRNAALRSSTQ